MPTLIVPNILNVTKEIVSALPTKLTVSNISNVTKEIVNVLPTNTIDLNAGSFVESALQGVSGVDARPTLVYVSKFKSLFDEVPSLPVNSSSFDTNEVYERGTDSFFMFDAKLQSRYLTTYAMKSYLEGLPGGQKSLLQSQIKQNSDFINNDATTVRDNLFNVIRVTRAAEDSLIFNKKSYTKDSIGSSALFDFLNQEYGSAAVNWSSTKIWLQSVAILEHFFKYGYKLEDLKNKNDAIKIDTIIPKDDINLFSIENTNSGVEISTSGLGGLIQGVGGGVSAAGSNITKIKNLVFSYNISNFARLAINDDFTKKKLHDVIPIELIKSLKSNIRDVQAKLGDIPNESFSLPVPTTGLTSLAYAQSADSTTVLNFEDKFLENSKNNIFIPGQSFYLQNQIDQIALGNDPAASFTVVNSLNSQVENANSIIALLSQSISLRSTLTAFETNFLNDSIGEAFRRACGANSSYSAINFDDESDLFGAVLASAYQSDEALSSIFSYVYNLVVGNDVSDSEISSILDVLKLDTLESLELANGRVPNDNSALGNIINLWDTLAALRKKLLNTGSQEEQEAFFRLGKNEKEVENSLKFMFLWLGGDVRGETRTDQEFIDHVLHTDKYSLAISAEDIILYCLQFGSALFPMAGHYPDELKGKIPAPPGFKSKDPNYQSIIDDSSFENFLSTEFQITGGQIDNYLIRLKNELVNNIRSSFILSSIVSFFSDLKNLLQKCCENGVTKFSGMGDSFVMLSYFLMIAQAYSYGFSKKLSYKSSLVSLTNSQYSDNYTVYVFEPKLNTQKSIFADSARSAEFANRIMSAMQTDLTSIRDALSNFSTNVLGVNKKDKTVLSVPEICAIVTGSLSDGARASSLVNEEQTYLLSNHIDDFKALLSSGSSSEVTRFDGAVLGVNSRDFLCNFFSKSDFLTSMTQLKDLMILAVGIPLGYKRFIHSRAQISSNSGIDAFKRKQLSVVKVDITCQDQIDLNKTVIASYYFDLDLLPSRVDSLIRPLDTNPIPFRDYSKNMKGDVFYSPAPPDYDLINDQSGNIVNISGQVKDNHTISFALENYVRLMSGIDATEKSLFQGNTSSDLYGLQASQEVYGNQNPYVKSLVQHSISSISDTKIMKKYTMTPHLFDRVFYVLFDAKNLVLDELQVAVTPVGGQVF